MHWTISHWMWTSEPSGNLNIDFNNAVALDPSSFDLNFVITFGSMGQLFVVIKIFS